MNGSVVIWRSRGGRGECATPDSGAAHKRNVRRAAAGEQTEVRPRADVKPTLGDGHGVRAMSLASGRGEAVSGAAAAGMEAYGHAAGG